MRKVIGITLIVVGVMMFIIWLIGGINAYLSGFEHPEFGYSPQDGTALAIIIMILIISLSIGFSGYLLYRKSKKGE